MVEEKESILALATALATVRGGADAPFAHAFAALDELEQLLFRHKDAFGIQNVQFQQGCEEFVLLCNTAAIQRLPHAASGSDELDRCGDLLMRAEQHTRRAGYLRSMADQLHTSGRAQLRLLSLNNLACYNKQIGKSLAAIGFLEEALEIQLREQSHHTQEGDDASSDAAAGEIALTHLNLCAVLSLLRRHDAAAEHARSAIALMQRVAESNELSVDASVLVIAHYNLAVEQEHLCELARAAATTQRGLAVARRYELDRETSEAVRLLEDMHRTTRDRATARSLSPRRAGGRTRPASPRTLRQMC